MYTNYMNVCESVCVAVAVASVVVVVVERACVRALAMSAEQPRRAVDTVVVVAATTVSVARARQVTAENLSYV